MPDPPRSITQFRAAKAQQSLDTQKYLQVNESLLALRENVKVTNIEISLPEVAGHKFSLRVYEPVNRSHKLSLMLYFHGGY